MSDSIQTGHQHEVEPAHVVELNEQLVDLLDAGRRARLVETIVRLAGRPESESADELGAVLRDLGIEQPEPVVTHLAENIARAGADLTVIDSTGNVLHGDPSFDVTAHSPDVEGTEDPEHDDRPVYS